MRGAPLVLLLIALQRAPALELNLVAAPPPPQRPYEKGFVGEIDRETMHSEYSDNTLQIELKRGQ
jgi:hypothetical protein